MERHRVRDGLIGAAVAIAVLLVATVVAFWLVSDPAGSGDRAPSAESPAAGAPSDGSDPSVGEPPADLGDDETWLGDLAMDAGTVVTAGSLLRDVQAVARDVRTGPEGVVAGRLAVDATVPFEVVGARLGEGTTVRPAGDSEATVRRPVRFLGRDLDVAATGTVRAVAGRRVVEPRSVDVGGPDALADAIGTLVRRLVTIEQSVEGLPEGLVLRDVAVRPDGFRASLDGTDVRLASAAARPER